MKPLSPPGRRDAEHPRPSHPLVDPWKEAAGWVMLWRWDWGVGRGDQINKGLCMGLTGLHFPWQVP